MLVWVTGLSGTGKSAIAQRLDELGHRAVDADDNGMSRWCDRVSGEMVPSPPDGERPADWLERYCWSIDGDQVAALSRSEDGSPVFLLGAVENEAEVLPLADVVVCLVADAETLTRRLESRVSNSFGKTPGDIEAVLKWLGEYEDRHEAEGAVMIDATRSLPLVVADVLAAAGGNRM